MLRATCVHARLYERPSAATAVALHGVIVLKTHDTGGSLSSAHIPLQLFSYLQILLVLLLSLSRSHRHTHMRAYTRH